MKAWNDLTLIYSDGACSGNPGPGGWGAIIATGEGDVLEIGGGAKGTTNNRMEITAALEALRTLHAHRLKSETFIYTDSTYVIRGVTQWIFGWKRKGWINGEGQPVVNRDLWEALDQEVRRCQTKTKIKWLYCRGHTGVAGNERCDEIAVAFSQGKQSVDLYEGSINGYPVPIFPPPEEQPLPEMKPKNGVKAKPYSYLSMVNGKIERHPDWSSCEARVKGRPGAKFKKAMTAEEEESIIASWKG